MHCLGKQAYLIIAVFIMHPPPHSFPLKINKIQIGFILALKMFWKILALFEKFRLRQI